MARSVGGICASDQATLGSMLTAAAALCSSLRSAGSLTAALLPVLVAAGAGFRVGLGQDFLFCHRKFRSANFMKLTANLWKFDSPLSTVINMGRHRSVGRSKNGTDSKTSLLTPFFERLSWFHRFSWLYPCDNCPAECVNALRNTGT